MNTAAGFVWMIGLGLVGGIATGFAVPLVTSYEPSVRMHAERISPVSLNVVEIQPLDSAMIESGKSVSHYDVDRDAEVERLAARNRRLLAMLAALKRRDSVTPVKPIKVDSARELRSEVFFAQQ